MPLERYPQPDVVLPNDDDLICRYYRFNRFAELVRTSQLHFCRADLFKDENEGIPPDEYIREICRQHPEADLNHMKGSLAQDREASFASCWYNSDAETAKMWARYGRDEETGEDGVAVISTFGKLKTAISALPDRVMLGPINYSRKHFGYNVLRFITTKLPDFGWEHEIRALIWVPEWAGQSRHFDIDNNCHPKPLTPPPPHVPKGLLRNLDLATLIDHIVISPEANEGRLTQVEQLVASRGLRIPVRKSALGGYRFIVTDLDAIIRYSDESK